MSIALLTSQVLSQIKSGTLVILVYDRETVLQVVHNRGHGFQKDLPCRGAQIATHTRSTSEKPNQNPTRHSRQSNLRTQVIQHVLSDFLLSILPEDGMTVQM